MKLGFSRIGSGELFCTLVEDDSELSALVGANDGARIVVVSVVVVTVVDSVVVWTGRLYSEYVVVSLFAAPTRSGNISA